MGRRVRLGSVYEAPEQHGKGIAVTSCGLGMNIT